MPETETYTVTSREGAEQATYDGVVDVHTSDLGDLVLLGPDNRLLGFWAPGSWQRVEVVTSEVTA